MVDFAFTPRDTTGLNDTLDLRLNCVFDKPYDLYFEGNLTGKTNNRFGPGVVLGLIKRNAFRGGELLDIKLKGNYEWQTGHQAEGTSSRFNSYEYGFDVSLQMPRLVVPYANYIRRQMRQRFRKNGFYVVPTTTLKVSSDIISRANFFKRHVVSGELTYNVQTSVTSRHQFSPLVFSFEFMRSSTAAFDSILMVNPYLLYTMQDRLCPRCSTSIPTPVPSPTATRSGGRPLSASLAISCRWPTWLPAIAGAERQAALQQSLCSVCQDRVGTRQDMAAERAQPASGPPQRRGHVGIRQLYQGTLQRTVLCGWCQQHTCVHRALYRPGRIPQSLFRRFLLPRPDWRHAHRGQPGVQATTVR